MFIPPQCYKRHISRGYVYNIVNINTKSNVLPYQQHVLCRLRVTLITVCVTISYYLTPTSFVTSKNNNKQLPKRYVAYVCTYHVNSPLTWRMWCYSKRLLKNSSLLTTNLAVYMTFVGSDSDHHGTGSDHFRLASLRMSTWLFCKAIHGSFGDEWRDIPDT